MTEVPDEVPFSEARAMAPADEKLATDPVGLAIARDFIAANQALFDRLADA
jgi:hypothetical protein